MMHGSNKTSRLSSLKRQLGVLASAAMLASVAAVGASISSANAATVDIYVCAKPGTASVANPATEGVDDPPGGADDSTITVPFLGFVKVDAPGDCATAIVNLGDPTPITVKTGDTVNLHLVNDTPITLNLSVTGFLGVPDLTGVATGGTDTYTYTAGAPGTYLLESDLNPRHTLMGLHSVLVVEPAAYGSAHGDAVSAFDQEEVLVIHEVDTAFLGSVDPMAFDLEDYDPDLHLINGQTHTVNQPITPIQAAAGDRVLVRYVNASSINSTMTVQGLRQAVVGFDGEDQTGSGAVGEDANDFSNLFMTAGQTAEVILTMGDDGDEHAILNRNLRSSAIRNNGMQLVMIQVGDGALPGGLIYFSLNRGSRTINTVNIRDEDVARFDGALSVHFDGSAHGLAGTDIAAAHVNDATGDVYFSLRQDFTVPAVLDSVGDWSDVGSPSDPLEEQDVYKFDNMLNKFSVWLDGSEIGLHDDVGRHDINGVSVDPISGITTFTTNGNINSTYQVPASTGALTLWHSRNEDIIRWVPYGGAADPSGPGFFEYVADMSDIVVPDPDNTPSATHKFSRNTNSVVLSDDDLMFSEASSNNAYTDNNDLIACINPVPAGPGTLEDSCASVSIVFDMAALLGDAGVGQVDAFSLG